MKEKKSSIHEKIVILKKDFKEHFFIQKNLFHQHKYWNTLQIINLVTKNELKKYVLLRSADLR